MRSRYQFRLADLLPLTALWPPCLIGMQWVVEEHIQRKTIGFLIFAEIWLSAMLLAGWCFGLKISNTLGFEGWKRLSTLAMGWLFVPAAMNLVLGVGMFGRALTEVWRFRGHEPYLIFAVLMFSLALVLHMSKLNGRADAAWAARQAGK